MSFQTPPSRTAHKFAVSLNVTPNPQAYLFAVLLMKLSVTQTIQRRITVVLNTALETIGNEVVAAFFKVESVTEFGCGNRLK